MLSRESRRIPMKSISAVLSSLRKDAGLSQRKVASDLGVSQAVLSHYENGAREPKLDFVRRACDYYAVSADYMLGRSDERNEKTPALMKALSDAVAELQDMKSSGDALLEKLKNVY